MPPSIFLFPTFKSIFVTTFFYTFPMKQANCFYSFFACILLVCLSACDKDQEAMEEVIPQAVRSDLSKRFPLAEIENYQLYSDGLCQIDFTDQQQNKGSAWYADETWKMTHTKIDQVQQLPPEARMTFENSGYGDARLLDIYQTEREGMEKSLYTLHFRYRFHTVENVEHYVFINDDGMLLATFTWIPNDPCANVKLPKDHFDFIAEKYNGAEIRGYVNNGGSHEYFIFHRDTVKYVFFGGEVAADKGFWKETRYELSIDTRIPENVARRLELDDPDFIYTNLYYIESEAGNAYLFQDKSHENELGYCIAENIEPEK